MPVPTVLAEAQVVAAAAEQITLTKTGHTMAGGANYLLVVVQGGRNASRTLNSVTYNGSAMTQLAKIEDNTGTPIAITGIYGVLNPASSGDIVATFSTNMDGIVMTVFDLSGVNPVNPLNTSNTSGSSGSASKSLSLTTTTETLMIGARLVNRVTSSFTPNTGVVEEYDLQHGPGGVGTYFVGSRSSSSAETFSFGCTVGATANGDAMAVVAIAGQPAVTATLATTFGDMTLSGAGTFVAPNVTATATITFGDMTLSGAGQSWVGTATITFGDMTLSGAGQSWAGSANLTFAAMTLSATATVAEYSASLNVTFDAMTVAGTGEIIGGTFVDPVYTLVFHPYDVNVESQLAGPPFPGGVNDYEVPGQFSHYGETVEFYAASGSYITHASDTPASTEFPARVANAINYEQRLFDGVEPGRAQRAGFGTIELAVPDGGLDNWLGLDFDGRQIEIFVGERTAAWATHQLVANVTSAGFIYNTGMLTVRTRDFEERLSVLLSHTLYTGTGNLEGKSDLEGTMKPQSYGRCFNIEPVLADGPNLIYQFHDRAAQAVDAVRDGGVPLLVDGGDFPSYVALAGTIVTPGHVATCLAEGLFKLGALPEARVTCDVRGDAYGGYVETAAAIGLRVVRTRGNGAFTDNKINTGTFETLEAEQPAPVGVYVSQPIPAAELLNYIMSGINGYWFVTLNDRLNVGLFKEPAATPDYVFDRNKADIARNGDINVEQITPRYATEVGYQRRWQVQETGELLGAVPAEDRALYGTAYSFARINDIYVHTKHPLARRVIIGAPFALKADAEAEAVRAHELYKVPREVVTIGVNTPPFSVYLGKTVELRNINRFGWGAAKRFRVIAATSNVRSGIVELTLWG